MVPSENTSKTILLYLEHLKMLLFAVKTHLKITKEKTKSYFVGCILSHNIFTFIFFKKTAFYSPYRCLPQDSVTMEMLHASINERLKVMQIVAVIWKSDCQNYHMRMLEYSCITYVLVTSI